MYNIMSVPIRAGNGSSGRLKLLNREEGLLVSKHWLAKILKIPLVLFVGVPISSLYLPWVYAQHLDSVLNRRMAL